MLRAFLFILIAYLVALAVAYFFLQNFSANNILLETFYADVIATTVIFIFSLVFQNASFYDPYWSVAPFMIAIFWNEKSVTLFSFQNKLILAAFLIWGIRLTLNWARGWKGLHHEDWRYIQLKNQTGSFYPAVNFLGIHLFPTVMVFVAMIPAYYAMMNSSLPFSLLDITAFIICITAALIELIADEQQRNFKRRRASEREFIQSGLWKYSRHPNYFGEVLFWWGIYLFAIAANPYYWWTIIGAISITMLFLFISIPMMEKHMIEKRPDYSNYQKTVSGFIPWIPKK